MAQLECKNLTLGYGTKTVIEDLSFSVNKGDYLCIVGENGSGKTTLMKTILRLLKPLSGTIETGDGLLPDEISYLPQQPDETTRDRWVKEIAAYCDNAARGCIDEARPMLEELHETYPMMLVSNFYGNIDEVLRSYGIRHLFKGIIESAVVGIRKPNPTLFRLGVDALELNPEEVLVVGDSLRKDIEPAEQLGCHVLWLKGKGWTDEEDQQTHPHTITRVTQVLDWLNSL